MKVVMTGAAGGVAGMIRPHLRSHLERLVLSDRVEVGGLERNESFVQADMTDLAAMERLLQGADGLIHLGGQSVEGPWQAVLDANIIGLYNVYEAARRQGCRRIVFATTNHVVGFYRQHEVIDALAPPKPDTLYGVSKAFGENLSRMYWDRYGIETVCLRIGSAMPEPQNRRMLATWLSFDDLHRLISACLSTPVLGHSIVFGMSDNAVTWWDNSRAKHIGYVPQDSSDVFRDAVFARTPAPDLKDPAAIYQGGGFVKADPFKNN